MRFGALTAGGTSVPGVDFERIRTEITMEQVLNLVGFQPVKRSGAQWYGRCPLHESTTGSTLSLSKQRRRSFSVNVATGRYCCHSCRSHGNPLELWAAATKLSLHQAAIDLCHRLGRDVPWIRR
jgi:DNA primase